MLLARGFLKLFSLRLSTVPTRMSHVDVSIVEERILTSLLTDTVFKIPLTGPESGMLLLVNSLESKLYMFDGPALIMRFMVSLLQSRDHLSLVDW